MKAKRLKATGLTVALAVSMAALAGCGGNNGGNEAAPSESSGAFLERAERFGSGIVAGRAGTGQRSRS